jgi:predicted nucleotidyltransferase
MLNTEAYVEAIESLCKAYSVKELGLFGSAVCDDFGPDSDVDVLVIFDGTDDLFNRYMGLLDGLRSLFDRDVDLVMADAIKNPVFEREVMSQRKPIYAA